METVLSLCLGVGLSAACGFRVFVPLLFTCIAALSGHLNLSPGFEWIGSYPALIAFIVATGFEIAGYYIPWLDHFLDSLATPAAVVAGTMITASQIQHMTPFLKWTMALIAGGGAAATVQSLTVLARGASLVGTGGLANPLVATVELGSSVFACVLSIIAPVVTLICLIGFVFVTLRIARARMAKKVA
jgi:hypothetical protein